jgi:hypothetical protein
LGILEISNMVYSHWLLYIYTFVTGGMSLYICRHFCYQYVIQTF